MKAAVDLIELLTKVNKIGFAMEEDPVWVNPIALIVLINVKKEYSKAFTLG
jgi:hypothetical protein